MDLNEVFEREAAHFTSEHKEGDGFKLGILKDLAQKGGIFLDVGCGNGYFTDRVLAETNIEWACALDYSSAMLELNRKSARKSLIRASVLNIPFAPARFSMVHADAVLHHLVAPSRKKSVQQAYHGLHEIIDQASPGGVVFVSERCVKGYLGDAFSARFIFSALKHFSQGWIGKLFHVPQGLLVSFLTPKEFLTGIEQAGGHVRKMEVIHSKPGLLFRLALCRDHPRIHVLIEPDRKNGEEDTFVV